MHGVMPLSLYLYLSIYQLIVLSVLSVLRVVVGWKGWEGKKEIES